MKAKVSQGTAFILLETDMRRAKALDESKLTDLQKHCLATLPDKAREQILAGQGAVVKNIADNSTVCDFNMENYHPPEHALENLASSLLPMIQDYYSKEENMREFEEWQKKQNKGK